MAEAAAPVIKVAAVCCSLRESSYNRGLLLAAMELAKSIDGLEIEHVDISPLPFLNTDLEVDGTYPPAVEAFRQRIQADDGPLKNALDWASRPPNVCADKVAAVVSASGGSGGRRSQYHLRQICVFLIFISSISQSFSSMAMSLPPNSTATPT